MNDNTLAMTDDLKAPARKRNPEGSRRRILDAGEHAFALRGFGGARLRDIAQEAGVHHALVHHYYGDKRGLLQEVIRRGLERLALACGEALADSTTLDATTRAFVGALFDFCSENRGLLRIIDDAFRNRELVSFDVTQEALSTLAGPVLTGVRHTIEQGQKHGTVRSDISVDSLLVLNFGAIVYRFDTAESLLSVLGMPERNVQDMAVEREHTIQFVLAAMMPR
jgi:AcrR family transcriptional regulator